MVSSRSLAFFISEMCIFFLVFQTLGHETSFDIRSILLVNGLTNCKRALFQTNSKTFFKSERINWINLFLFIYSVVYSMTRCSCWMHEWFTLEPNCCRIIMLLLLTWVSRWMRIIFSYILLMVLRRLIGLYISSFLCLRIGINISYSGCLIS